MAQEGSRMTTTDLQKMFHTYDSIVGIHRRLRKYIKDNGRNHLSYFIAHLSHDVYKSRGTQGHETRQEIRTNLKKLANQIFLQIYGEKWTR